MAIFTTASAQTLRIVTGYSTHAQEITTIIPPEEQGGEQTVTTSTVIVSEPIYGTTSAPGFWTPVTQAEILSMNEESAYAKRLNFIEETATIAPSKNKVFSAMSHDEDQRIFNF